MCHECTFGIETLARLCGLAALHRVLHQTFWFYQIVDQVCIAPLLPSILYLPLGKRLASGAHLEFLLDTTHNPGLRVAYIEPVFVGSEKAMSGVPTEASYPVIYRNRFMSFKDATPFFIC